MHIYVALSSPDLGTLKEREARLMRAELAPIFYACVGLWHVYYPRLPVPRGPQLTEGVGDWRLRRYDGLPGS